MYYLFCVAAFFIYPLFICSKEIIYVIPNDKKHLNDKLFLCADITKKETIWNPHWEPNMWWHVKKLLEQQSHYVLHTPSRIDLKMLDKAKFIVDTTYPSRFAFHTLFKNNKDVIHKTIAVLWEPPVVAGWLWQKDFHKKLYRILTWDDALVDNKKYFTFRMPVYSGFKLTKVIPFQKKKLCCFINGNKTSGHSDSLYQERLNSVLFFENNAPDSLDFFGTKWPQDTYRTYRGTIPEGKKRKVQQQYRFCICYENMRNVQGYLTEKLFNCFEAGCVPIYWGIDNVTAFVPEGCFVDRRKFSSHEELYHFISTMGEAEYNTYIENIKTYLKSERPHEFSVEQFACCVVKCLLAS